MSFLAPLLIFLFIMMSSGDRSKTEPVKIDQEELKRRNLQGREAVKMNKVDRPRSDENLQEASPSMSERFMDFKENFKLEMEDLKKEAKFFEEKPVEPEDLDKNRPINPEIERKMTKGRSLESLNDIELRDTVRRLERELDYQEEKLKYAKREIKEMEKLSPDLASETSARDRIIDGIIFKEILDKPRSLR